MRNGTLRECSVIHKCIEFRIKTGKKLRNYNDYDKGPTYICCTFLPQFKSCQVLEYFFLHNDAFPGQAPVKTSRQFRTFTTIGKWDIEELICRMKLTHICYSDSGTTHILVSESQNLRNGEWDIVLF